MLTLALSGTGPPPPLPPLQPAGMDGPPNSITSSVPTIVTSGMRSSLPPLSRPLFNSGNVSNLLCSLYNFRFINMLLYFTPVFYELNDPLSADQITMTQMCTIPRPPASPILPGRSIVTGSMPRDPT